MVAISPDARQRLAEHTRESSPIAGLVHALVLVVPVWLLIGSAALVAVIR